MQESASDTIAVLTMVLFLLSPIVGWFFSMKGLRHTRQPKWIRYCIALVCAVLACLGGLALAAAADSAITKGDLTLAVFTALVAVLLFCPTLLIAQRGRKGGRVNTTPEPSKPSAAPPLTAEPNPPALTEEKYADHLNTPHTWPAAEQPKQFSSAGIHALTEAQTIRDSDTLSRPSAADLNATFQFTYKKSNGSSSKRHLLLRSGTEQNGVQYLNGVCLDSNQTRTFRIDRIESTLTQADTGEIFNATDVYAALETSGRTERETQFFGGDVTPRSTPKPSGREWVAAVYFAGFRGSKYEELERIAINAGWRVRMSISSTVDYVVANGQAGAKQIAQADELGIRVIDEDEFRSTAT